VKFNSTGEKNKPKWIYKMSILPVFTYDAEEKNVNNGSLNSVDIRTMMYEDNSE